MKTKSSLLAAIFFGLIFLILIGFRTGLLVNKAVPPPVASETEVSPKDTWMGIYQNNHKIGYTHRTMSLSDTGYSLSETTYMKLNVMGMIEEVFVETGGQLNKNFALSSFHFSLKSGLFQFAAYGGVKDKKLVIYIDGKRTDIPIDDEIHLTSGLVEAAWGKGLKPGDSRNLEIFDPSTLSKRPVTISVIGKEKIDIMGEKIPSTKLLIDFMGTQQTAWMDEKGEVVKEEGLLSISLERTDKETALSGISDDALEDLTHFVSIKPDQEIISPRTLTKIAYRLGGVKNGMDLDGGRQTYREGVLTIKQEGIGLEGHDENEDLSPYLRPEAFIQSDHLEIKKIAEEITEKSRTDLEKALNILKWMNETIEKRPVVSVPDALSTLKNRGGDCNEHAVLVAALARAARIPSDIESGVVYMKGRFYYHAWNRLYIGNTWITLDAALNQFPADVTHIRFVKGGLSKQVDLISVIGKMTISIIEDEK